MYLVCFFKMKEYYIIIYYILQILYYINSNIILYYINLFVIKIKLNYFIINKKCYLSF